jgi:hypothetical protein
MPEKEVLDLSRRGDLNRSAISVASRCMIANIASDDALILPHRANPAGLNFRERQGPEHGDHSISRHRLGSVRLRAYKPPNIVLAQTLSACKRPAALPVRAEHVKLHAEDAHYPGRH